MLEQDYVMRLIKEMIRTLLKLFFHIGSENDATEIFNDTEQKNMLQGLMRMVDNGNINEAENQVYEMTQENDRDMEHLKLALLFYSYLNDKDNNFLEQHDFSREEVRQGMEGLISRYGLDSFADTFLS